jgi:hypothetical protein
MLRAGLSVRINNEKPNSNNYLIIKESSITELPADSEANSPHKTPRSAEPLEPRISDGSALANASRGGANLRARGGCVQLHLI